MGRNSKEIIEAIISALGTSRVASSDRGLKKSLLRVASQNHELRPHILPPILEKGGFMRDPLISELLGKSLRKAYEHRESREDMLPLIRIALDKMSAVPVMKMTRRFKMWADQNKLKGRSPKTNKDVLVSSIVDALIEDKQDPLTNSDVQRAYTQFIKVMSDEKKRRAQISHGKKKKHEKETKIKVEKFKRTPSGRRDPRGKTKQILDRFRK